MLSTNTPDIEYISVVVPVYNNASTLTELINRLQKVLVIVNRPYELIFVVDASPDDSLGLLREAARTHSAVKILALPRNLGQNRAILQGIAHARGTAVVTLDADLQDPPEAIPGLLPPLDNAADVVFGGRCGAYESRARLRSSQLFKNALHWLSGKTIPRDAGLFLAMNRRVAEYLVSLQIPDPYIIAMMSRSGFQLVSVPVERSTAAGGLSGYTTRKRFALAWKAFSTLLRLRQMRTGKPAGSAVSRASEEFEAQIVKINF